MWQSKNFLVPQLNGMPYSHKPPLLFWLINMGWFLSGVNELSARLVGPFFGLCNLFLTAYLARRLCRGKRPAAPLAPFILLSFPLWAVFSTLTMFDMVLTFFVLLASVGLLTASVKRGVSGWIISTVSIGFGLLAKGPVMLIYIVPFGLLAPWWITGEGGILPRGWYGKFFLSITGGIAVALLWALPAANAGGTDYVQGILWHQTAGRIIKSFSHRHPLWWYLPLMPLVLFPWSFTWYIWKGIKRVTPDRGTKACLSLIVPPFIILSLISCKQIHYLLPVLPPAAILVAKIIHSIKRPLPHRFHRPVATLFIVTGFSLIFIPSLKAGSADIPVIKDVGYWSILMFSAGIILFLWRPDNINKSVMSSSFAVSAFLILILIGPFRSIAPAYDVSKMATRIADVQKAGKKIAHYRKYHGQYHFAGRLETPLKELNNRDELAEWISRNPEGYVVTSSSRHLRASAETGPEYAHPFRGRWAELWKAKAIARIPEIIGHL